MKIEAFIAPGTLLSVGLLSTSANAVEYIATDAGTPITLAGAAAPQYSFDIDPGFIADEKTYIKANGTATVKGPTNVAYTNLSQTRAESSSTPPFFTNGNYDLLFSANGVDYQGIATVVDEGRKISDITFSPLAPGVPEPSTWASMILGLGAVGGAMRAQRRRRHERLANA